LKAEEKWRALRDAISALDHGSRNRFGGYRLCRRRISPSSAASVLISPSPLGRLSRAPYCRRMQVPVRVSFRQRCLIDLPADAKGGRSSFCASARTPISKRQRLSRASLPERAQGVREPSPASAFTIAPRPGASTMPASAPAWRRAIGRADGKFSLRHLFTQRNQFRHLLTKCFV
jgi:hypothetical protein